MTEKSQTRSLVKLDIVKFAREVLSEVESTRAYKLAFDNETKTKGELPVESRVNAFFRLVGLPMFVTKEPISKDDKASKNKAGQLVLTPGYDEGEQIWHTVYTVQNSKDVKLKDPAGTGNEVPISELVDTRREKVLKERESKIGTETYNKAMIKALYRVETPDLYVHKTIFPGYDYVKAVAPFVTSYIDVQPHNRELAKPFVADPKNTEVDGKQLKHPFIETAIRIRLSTSSGADQTQATYLQALNSELTAAAKMAFGSDSDVFKNVAPSLLPSQASLLEAFIISNMVSIIDQLAEKWVKLQRLREKIVKESEMALVPKTESSKQSAFGRQSNTSLNLQIAPTSALGRRRAKLKQRVAVSSAIIGLIPIEDAMGTTKKTAQFASTKNVASNALTRPFLSLLRQDLDQEQKQLEKVERQIQEESRKANQLRLEIEALTGEFTGLSVVDVVFTILALFLIERKYLIGLLDPSTKNLMKLDKTLKDAVESAGDATAVASVEEVADKVSALYDLLIVAIAYTYDKKKRSSINRSPQSSQQTNRKVNVSTSSNNVTEDISSSGGQ